MDSEVPGFLIVDVRTRVGHGQWKDWFNGFRSVQCCGQQSAGVI